MEPERVLVRRALPVGAAVTLVAIAIAWFAGGSDAALSAAIGGAVVLTSAAVNGLALSWAAQTSPTFLAVVAGVSFFVRMAVIFAALALLDRTSFFSPAAFILAVVPIMLAMLVFESKLVMGPMGREIRIPDAEAKA